MAVEYEAINLSQGFPDFQVDQKLKDLINQFIQEDYNQYAPMAGVAELREAIKKKVSLLYNRNISHESEITITNGATEGIYSAGYIPEITPIANVIPRTQTVKVGLLI